MKLKKILAVLLPAAMIAGMLSGCGESTASSSKAASSEKTSSASEAASSSKASSAVSASSEKSSSASAAEFVTIVDAVDREVEIPAEVTRVGVINRYNLELLRACGHIDKVVAVDESIIENHIYWPEFSEEQSFGSQSEVNYETIAELGPQVVVTPFYSEDVEKALAPFDIPVVALIGYDQDVNRQVGIVESILGETEKSAALRSFYQDLYDELSSVAATIPEEEKKTAVWESIKDYSIANGSNTWGEMIELPGGINVFSDASFESSDVDAEAFIVADPDYIFKMVAGSGVDLSGYTPPSEEDYLTAQSAYLERPGFGEIQAVKDGNVFFVTSFCYGGMGKMIGSAYIAKLMYPEYYTDLDPDEVFATWMETFQNIDFVEGHTWRAGDHS